MLVSIIIPAFNEENTIIELLKKVNLQETKDLAEIIVIDDGSFDNTKEILKENPSLYTKLIELENLGKGGAVREGLKRYRKLRPIPRCRLRVRSE